MKTKQLSNEELEKRKKMKFFQLLNDEIFWIKFCSVTLKNYRITQLREYRTKLLIPKQKVLSNFIDEDYRIITGDTRDTREIILDLLSITEDGICEE